jgi:hypothetical protein
MQLTTRAELLREEPDHPRAGEEYYKLQIGALERLPQPILAKTWRRITFLYTTGEYLLNAKTVFDLVVQSEERRVLLQALRERASQGYGTQNLPEGDLPEDILAVLLGIKRS